VIAYTASNDREEIKKCKDARKVIIFHFF